MTYSYFFSFLFLNNCKSIVFILLHQTICYIFYCFPYNFQLKDPFQPPLQRGGVQPCRSSWLINYISKNLSSYVSSPLEGRTGGVFYFTLIPVFPG